MLFLWEMEASTSLVYDNRHSITCRINFKTILKAESKEAQSEEGTLGTIYTLLNFTSYHLEGKNIFINR